MGRAPDNRRSDSARHISIARMASPSRTTPIDPHGLHQARVTRHAVAGKPASFSRTAHATDRTLGLEERPAVTSDPVDRPPSVRRLEAAISLRGRSGPGCLTLFSEAQLPSSPEGLRDGPVRRSLPEPISARHARRAAMTGRPVRTTDQADQSRRPNRSIMRTTTMRRHRDERVPRTWRPAGRDRSSAAEARGRPRGGSSRGSRARSTPRAEHLRSRTSGNNRSRYEIGGCSAHRRT